MELLLELIEKEKLNVTELSLATVADEYLEHIRNSSNISLSNLAEFLSIASKLILIKSRALLPLLKFTDEEEEEIKDLTYQLEEYKKFKAASAKLQKMINLGRVCYSRLPFFGVRSVFYPPENINTFDLKKVFLEILADIPVLEKLQEEIVTEIVTLEDRINDMEVMLRQRVESSFQEMVSEATNKVDVIVSFLAMLEMVKQRLIEVDQREIFQDINMRIKER